MTSLEEVFLKSNEQLHEIKVQNVDEVVQVGNDLENSVPEEDKEVPKDTLNLVGKGTLCEGIGALIVKRLQIYKRDISGYICELIVPLVLVLAGVIITLTAARVTIADPRPIVPQNYPGPQRILLNENLIAATPGNISPQDLFASLPDSDSQF